MHILVVNCGSSSLKVRLVDIQGPVETPLATGTVEAIGTNALLTFRAAGEREQRRATPVADWAEALGALLDLLPTAGGSVDAVGHRVVHGGSYSRPTVIDDEVIAEIDDARKFAPLHNGPSLEGVRAARRRLPGVPMVAVFDTEFHASMPDVAAFYALPREVSMDLGVRRYGYHGIAHRSMSERYAELTGMRVDDVSAITLQLGNGCSATAVRGRASVDTSMGFTPLEGLVMGTRSGDLDPAAVLYLQREHAMSVEQIDGLLNHRSGLMGVSGDSADMAALLDGEARGDPHAHAAIELFCYRVRKYIGAYMAVLERVQAVIFGGGIGERSPEIRRRICEPLASLGLAINVDRNAALHGAEGRFSTEDSAIVVYVIPSDEERIIARETFELLAR